MTLDELYGADTFNKLSQALFQAKAGPVLEESPSAVHPDDEVVLTVKWDDGRFVGLVCRADSVYFFQCAEDPQLHRGLERVLPKLMKAWGVTTFRSRAFTNQGKSFLRTEHPGFKEVEPGSLDLTWSL